LARHNKGWLDGAKLVINMTYDVVFKFSIVAEVTQYVTYTESRSG